MQYLEYSTVSLKRYNEKKKKKNWRISYEDMKNNEEFVSNLKQIIKTFMDTVTGGREEVSGSFYYYF